MTETPSQRAPSPLQMQPLNNSNWRHHLAGPGRSGLQSQTISRLSAYVTAQSLTQHSYLNMVNKQLEC